MQINIPIMRNLSSLAKDIKGSCNMFWDWSRHCSNGMKERKRVLFIQIKEWTGDNKQHTCQTMWSHESSLFWKHHKSCWIAALMSGYFFFHSSSLIVDHDIHLHWLLMQHSINLVVWKHTNGLVIHTKPNLENSRISYEPFHFQPIQTMSKPQDLQLLVFTMKFLDSQSFPGVQRKTMR